MVDAKAFGFKFEKAIRTLSQKIPLAEALKKPTLFHCVRVGVFLYENGYPEEVILAGILHDALEDTNLTEKELNEEFGKTVTTLVKANTKNKSIERSEERIEELIKRCAKTGKEALIVKAADILDNFDYFSRVKSEKGLAYCVSNTKEVIRNWPKSFNDQILRLLKKELKKFS